MSYPSRENLELSDGKGTYSDQVDSSFCKFCIDFYVYSMPKNCCEYGVQICGGAIPVSGGPWSSNILFCIHHMWWWMDERRLRRDEGS